MHAVLLSCPFSRSRLYQKRHPWPSASNVLSGGVSGEGVLAAQRSVWATAGCAAAVSVLARTHPHAPAVPRQARRRRVSLHWVRTLWGSLVRVCPAIQRLPVCLPQCPNGTPEFLWLSFRLREVCAGFTQLSNLTASIAPALVPFGSVLSCPTKVAPAGEKQLKCWWKKNSFGRGEQGWAAGPPALQLREGQPLSRSHHCPQSWENKEGLGCCSLFVPLPASTVVHFAASVWQLPHELRQEGGMERSHVILPVLLQWIGLWIYDCIGCVFYSL